MVAPVTPVTEDRPARIVELLRKRGFEATWGEYDLENDCQPITLIAPDMGEIRIDGWRCREASNYDVANYIIALARALGTGSAIAVREASRRARPLDTY